ncbi:triggering receptor expressed on myeloid cells 1-like [Arvicola amphibius]|uniref:triggering receptor expressed on myeloid cells 1-like n=1 Tax=Arvicola amphibius TaxID=1047088 RepID=UPI001C081170|nr:triggering receptor expressed on myeloid cells 1-like [Arvicola amphibius]
MAWEDTYLLPPILLVLLASGSWAELLHTVEGQTTFVKCQYNSNQHSKEKIWCQQTSTERCKVLVSSLSTDTQQPKFSIRDHPDSRFFTVTMTALTVRDSGVYSCEIPGNDRATIILKRIFLAVSEEVSTLMQSYTEKEQAEQGKILNEQFEEKGDTRRELSWHFRLQSTSCERGEGAGSDSSDTYDYGIRTFIYLTKDPILITSKYLHRDWTMTQSTALVSSPDPGVTFSNVTNIPRVSISSIMVPMVCGLLSKTLIFTVLFAVTWRSFGGQTMKPHNSGL